VVIGVAVAGGTTVRGGSVAVEAAETVDVEIEVVAVVVAGRDRAPGS
jgi:hypothetical protein